MLTPDGYGFVLPGHRSGIPIPHTFAPPKYTSGQQKRSAQGGRVLVKRDSAEKPCQTNDLPPQIKC